MQKEPSGAAVQACVREQRALSVPKKQPREDFHPVGPCANAVGGACVGLWKKPRDRTLHGSRERTLCYRLICTVEPHSYSASLCTAASTEQGEKNDRKTRKSTWKCKEKNIRRDVGLSTET